jgi:catechol 2,3-dioxygenase-like lactoylglutathione lyase family enzyme
MTQGQTLPSSIASGKRGIPTIRGMEHIGLCVPKLSEAIAFFCDVIGCEYLYQHGPFIDDRDGPENYYTKWIGLHPRTKARMAMLRCANGANLEIFEIEAPGQRQVVPPFSDHGSAHFCFYVDDIEAAAKFLEEKGVRMGEVQMITRGPEGGVESAALHFFSPWGQMLELVSYPHGRAYERETDKRLWVPTPA